MLIKLNLINRCWFVEYIYIYNFAGKKFTASWRRSAKLFKVYTWFAHWCAGGQKTFLQSLHLIFKQWKINVTKKVYISGYETAEKVYTVTKKSLHRCKKKFTFLQKKVWIIYTKWPKRLPHVNQCKSMQTWGKVYTHIPQW